MADSLFAKGKYQQAAIEYERDFFLREDPSSLLYKAYSYKGLSDYPRALRALERISTSNQRLEQKSLYEKVIVNYLAANYQVSLNELLRYQFYGYEPGYNLLTVQVLSLIELLKWEEARQVMLTNMDIFGLSEADIEEILPQGMAPKKKKKAEMLSYFLPGVGQMYAGYIGKGLVSGTMIAGSIAFTGYSALTGYFFTGTMVGAAMFYTFYLGGARYATQLADRKNEELSIEIKQDFKKYLRSSLK